MTSATGLESAAPTQAAAGLTRRQGERLALDGVDFTVCHGENMLTGHLAPTAGHARIKGIDVAV